MIPPWDWKFYLDAEASRASPVLLGELFSVFAGVSVTAVRRVLVPSGSPPLLGEVLGVPRAGRPERALALTSPPAEISRVGRSFGAAAACVLGARLSPLDGLQQALLVAPPHPLVSEPGPEWALVQLPSPRCTFARGRRKAKGP